MGKTAHTDPTNNLRAKISKAYANQSSEALQQKRIMEYLPLVRHIVRKIVSPISNKMDIEDLISAGTLGLVKAAKGYDSSKDTEFKTYAYIRIRGAVLDELRSKSFVPPSVHKQIQLIRNAYSRLTTDAGVPPSDESLAAELGISPQQLYRSLEEARKQHFLSIHGLNDDQPALGALIPQDRSPSPEAQVEQKELLKNLTQAITELPKRDRLILLLYYERDLTMKEVAEVLNITESRVSQLHASAIFKLSMKLRSAA